MELVKKVLYFFTSVLIFTVINAQKIEYKKFVPENDECTSSQGVSGICKTISNCRSEFDKFRKSKANLVICSYGEKVQNSIICCPNDDISSNLMVGDKIADKSRPKDLLDFETCRNEFLRYRNSSINPNHFADALKVKRIPLNKQNCDRLDELNRNTKDFVVFNNYRCSNEPEGTYSRLAEAELVNKGDRPNMVAVGWTQSNGKIIYGCGGSIITDRFIVTAAHCRFLRGKQADTVRLGDRFLLTSEDDEIAQQLLILQFIQHQQYKSDLNYHDIALIKTVETILFNKFVVPSCIDDLDSQQHEQFSKWTVAGYGQTETGVASNVLLELEVYPITNQQCNKTYEDSDRLPNGITESQFCVKSQAIDGKIPGTCPGDSGSPLQFKSTYEVFPTDFNKTFVSTVYEVATVLGIVSFGVSCGLEIPTVYTKLAYYRNWMRSVVDNN